jgi:N-acetyl-anhydromuramyl-L-alanine amidase AmpD
LWHTGESSRKGKSKNGSLNAFAVGIEVIGPLNDGGFTDQQRIAVALLVQDICQRRNIQKEEFLRHKDIAPQRKVDIYDSFWNGKYKTWDEYRASLFIPNICPDVPADARYADAVQWAIEKGITNA